MESHEYIRSELQQVQEDVNSVQLQQVRDRLNILLGHLGDVLSEKEKGILFLSISLM